MPEKKVNIEPEKFREFDAEILDGGPSQDPGGSQDIGNGSQNPIEARKVEVLEKMNSSLDWLLDTVHSQAEKNDLPGIGDDQFRRDYAELGIMALEDIIDNMEDIEFLKKSPRYMFYIMTAGIVTQNALPMIRKKKNKKEEGTE